MLYTNETDRLLIIFKNNTKKIIDNVSAYGLLSDHKFFYFDGEDVKSFIPAESVLYFGSMNDWDDDKNVKDESIIIDRLKEYIHRLEDTKEYFNTLRDPGSNIQVNILNNIITDLKNEVLGEKK